MPSVFLGIRVDGRVRERLEIIASGRGSSLSKVVREALHDYVSSYTGEPTLRGLQRRIQEMDIRLKKVEDALIKAGGEALNGERFTGKKG